ncbi:MAG: DegT/DnrJ/EryC1/StrS family aminotransferase [Myxococcota bacterium]|nr:DegT/DnrJ/EryC1/StrS family aminotransferase [Myxococcota bacterium]
MSARIPLFSLTLADDVRAAVTRVLDSNWLTMGPETQHFEAEFAALHGVQPEHTIAVNSCTAALHLALAALRIGPGDEVIVPSLTFVATANAVRYVGATPVFADVVGAHDLTMDVHHVAQLITPKTKAVMPVHYAGYGVDMAALMAVCKPNGIAIVEDAAHAPGVCTPLGALGTIGDVGCFSFFSNKNVAIGEGGMLVCRDPALAQTLRLMRSHGMTHSTLDRDRGHAFSYDVIDTGFNYRIDELRSAIGRCQLTTLIADNDIRSEIVGLYRRLLADRAAGLGVVVPFTERDLNHSAYHIFPVVLPAGTKRQALMAYLRGRGIQTSIHYPPIHWFTDFRVGGEPVVQLPNTDDLAYRLMTLPLYPTMENEAVEEVVDALCAGLRARDLPSAEDR